MATTPAHSTRPIFTLAAAALVPLAFALGACGGGEKPAQAPAAPPASSAPSEAASAAPATSASAAPAPAPGETASAAPPTPSAGSSKVTIKTDPAWAACHRSYKAKARDVSKDVAAMAMGCAGLTKMKLVGKTLTGKQSDQQPPQSFPLEAKARHCYRVYAQAEDSIKDLDLAIKDSVGALAGEDATDDPSPVVKEDGQVCFNEDDDATVVVSVGMGAGAYAVQIWGD